MPHPRRIRPARSLEQHVSQAIVHEDDFLDFRDKFEDFEDKVDKKFDKIFRNQNLIFGAWAVLTTVISIIEFLQHTKIP